MSSDLREGVPDFVQVEKGSNDHVRAGYHVSGLDVASEQVVGKDGALTPVPRASSLLK